MKNQRHLAAKAATGRADVISCMATTMFGKAHIAGGNEVISMANTMFGEAHIAGWNGK
jgi:hypothetical protein